MSERRQYRSAFIIQLDDWREHTEQHEELSEEDYREIATVSLMRVSENTLVERQNNPEVDTSASLSKEQHQEIYRRMSSFIRYDLDRERHYIGELATNLVHNGVSWEETIEQIALCIQHMVPTELSPIEDTSWLLPGESATNTQRF